MQTAASRVTLNNRGDVHAVPRSRLAFSFCCLGPQNRLCDVALGWIYRYILWKVSHYKPPVRNQVLSAPILAHRVALNKVEQTGRTKTGVSFSQWIIPLSPLWRSSYTRKVDRADFNQYRKTRSSGDVRSLPVRMKIKHLCLKHTQFVSESPGNFKSIYQNGIKLCFSNKAMLYDMYSPLQL